MERVDIGEINPHFNEDDLDGKNPNLMKGGSKNNHGDIEEMAGTVSNRMIAKSLIPKVSVLKKALKSADIYIKFERITEEFNSLMYYNSIIELITWFVGFL